MLAVRLAGYIKCLDAAMVWYLRRLVRSLAAAAAPTLVSDELGCVEAVGSVTTASTRVGKIPPECAS